MLEAAFEGWEATCVCAMLAVVVNEVKHSDDIKRITLAKNEVDMRML
jgi:hypothetical protein